MARRFCRTCAFLILMALARGELAAEETHKVVWQTVREGGLVATYLRPKGDVVRPPLIVVGGSQGGLKPTEEVAYPFAERGWATLAVAYFGVEGLPPRLANIPLEYFDTAAAWLQRQPRVETGGMSIVGVSRGAELALLVAAHNPDFRRVVAYAPSHVAWGPVGRSADRAVSAWTRRGQPVPFVPPSRTPDYSAKPYRGTPDFLVDLRQTAAVQRAAIPVEKIQGAVLLISGDDDQVWPSTFMARQAMQRLNAARHPFRCEHLEFAGAGHAISPGSDPGTLEGRHPTGVFIALGGNKAANRAAQEKSWAHVLAFLRADPRRGP